MCASSRTPRFYVAGTKQDVLAIKAMLPSLDVITAVFSPPNPESILELLQARVPEADCCLKDDRIITLRVTGDQFTEICEILEEQGLPRPRVFHFRRKKGP